MNPTIRVLSTLVTGEIAVDVAFCEIVVHIILSRDMAEQLASDITRNLARELEPVS